MDNCKILFAKTLNSYKYKINKNKLMFSTFVLEKFLIINLIKPSLYKNGTK